MSLLSLRDMLIRMAAHPLLSSRTAISAILGACLSLAGCSSSEVPEVSDDISEPSSPMMIPVASEIPNADVPLSVPIGQQLVAERPHPQRSAPDATLSQTLKSGGSQIGIASSREPQLQIGDRAPELRVKQWIRERSTASADPSSRVQLITFWATWSVPSIAAIDRLPLLQRRFTSDVEMIGVSLETSEAVHGFLNSPRHGGPQLWKDYLSFAIAADHLGETEEKFLLSGYEQGLPASFVINKDGIIAWIGSADQCESVVARVLSGDWDIAAARQAHQLTQYRKSSQREIRDRLALARVSNDAEVCLRLIDELLEKFPNDVEFQMLRLRYQLRFEMADPANAQSAALLEQLRDDSLRLNQLAWTLAEHSAISGLDPATALSAAKRAVELTSESDASSLETLARVYFRRGETAAAIETLSTATKLEPGNQTLADTLEAFRKSTSSSIRKAGFHGSMM